MSYLYKVSEEQRQKIIESLQGAVLDCKMIGNRDLAAEFEDLKQMLEDALEGDIINDLTA